MSIVTNPYQTPRELAATHRDNKTRANGWQLSRGERVTLDLAIGYPLYDHQELIVSTYRDALWEVVDVWQWDNKISKPYAPDENFYVNKFSRIEPDLAHPMDTMLSVTGASLGVGSLLSAIAGLLGALAAAGVSYSIVRITSLFEDAVDDPEVGETVTQTIDTIGASTASAIAGATLPVTIPLVLIAGLLYLASD